jgi:hypothetical protein
VPIFICQICGKKLRNADVTAKCMTPAWFVTPIWCRDRPPQKNGPQRFGEATGQGQIPNFQQLYTDMRLHWLLSCHFDHAACMVRYVDLVPRQ